MGWYEVHEPADLDVCLDQRWNTRDDGRMSSISRLLDEADSQQYTYYTLSALGFKVPRRLKKSLTTMQIGQFLIGFTFAAGHLFVEYTLPVHMAYAGKHGLKHAASAVSAAAATVASGIADPTATAGAAAWLKKLAFRAAGEEGLAENVRNQYGEVFGPEADHVQSTLEQMRRSPKYEAVNCIDTTGQSFAIWLNLIYLAPLTWLFLRFFWRSYSRRSSVSTTHPTQRRKVVKSAEDAAHGVDRQVDSIGRNAENGLSEIAKKVGEKSADNEAVSETIGKIQKGLSKGYDAAVEKGKQLGEQAKAGTQSAKDQAKTGAQETKEQAKASAQDTKEKAKAGTRDTKEKAKAGTQDAKDEVSEKASKAKDNAIAGKDQRRDSAKDTAGSNSSKSSSESKPESKSAGNNGSKSESKDKPETKSEGKGDAGTEGSGVLVERHDEAADGSVKRAENEPGVASPPAATAPGSEQKSEEATSDKPVKEEEPQGLSNTDSTAPGAKSYAEELK